MAQTECVWKPGSKWEQKFSLTTPAVSWKATSSERKPNGIPGSTRTPSERSDAGISIVQEVFDFVNRKLSGAQRRKSAADEERGRGKDGTSCPRPAQRSPERDERSELHQQDDPSTLCRYGFNHTPRSAPARAVDIGPLALNQRCCAPVRRFSETAHPSSSDVSA